MEIPKEHQVTCPLCGTILDCRDLNHVLAHEWDPVTGKCSTISIETGLTSSRKCDDIAKWSKDKKDINLN